MTTLPPRFSDFDLTDAERSWWGPLAASRPAGVSSLPAVGAPFRVSFVGQRTYFQLCSQMSPSRVIDPTFIEFRAGADPRELKAKLAAARPHVVVMFRPEILPAGVLGDLRALVLGILTEPLPRSAGDAHDDLQRRLHDLAKIDPSQFDRVVSFDPHIIETARRFTPVWRACPLPVDDAVFGWSDMPRRPRPVFIGRSTQHREGFLQPAKHLYDLYHVEHGLFGEELVDVLHQRCDIAVNLHNEPYPTFENRVAMHLAAGNLLVSEPLSPAHGLEPGIDFLEVTTPDDLNFVLGQIARQPEAFEVVRVRGRQKAEYFRASRVWARLIHDLLYDVDAFGGRSNDMASGR